MELLIIIGIVMAFGMVALSAAAQRSAPQQPAIVYVRAEPIEKAEQGGGQGLLLFLVVVGLALWLL